MVRFEGKVESVQKELGIPVQEYIPIQCPSFFHIFIFSIFSNSGLERIRSNFDFANFFKKIWKIFF